MSEKPNLLWITVDSVRHDHTSLGEDTRDTTPAIADIAAEGQWTAEAVSQGDYTLPSSTSILTGTYPSQHTVGLDNDSLGDGIATFPEVLREAGYRTACLSRNAYLSEATNLDRGFDRFGCLLSSTLPSLAGPRLLAKYLWNIRRVSAGLVKDSQRHSTAYLMTEIGKRWLDDFSGEDPFFMYLHYNDPHRPYSPPLPYRDRFLAGSSMSGSEAASLSMDVHDTLMDRIAAGCEFSDEEMSALTAMYDAEIAHVDDQISSLFEHLRALDLDDTVVVITADHGEAFCEHGMLGHKITLHDAIVNVPLVVHGLDEQLMKTDDIVQHCDIVTTFANIVGASHDQFQGIDLRESTREFAVTQRPSVKQYLEELRDRNPAFDSDQYLAGPVTAIRTGDAKLLRSDEGTQFYDLDDESTDRASERPDSVERLSGLLETWLDEHGDPLDTGGEAAFSNEMKQQLENLGYL